ncbi:MAG TPA: zinc ribbon domain-containing protein [Thermomicrobiales bacterium]|jgi:RNA polymerase subunit RPABC4/transcription elongation factor Spt4
MEEIIARLIQALLALSGAYLVALWFVLVVWTFRDIETRSRSVITQVFSTLLVVLFYVPGVLLYMILRPKETLDGTFQRSLEEEYLLQDLEELPLCQSCQRYVEDDFILCPHCHTTLREPCVSCGRLVHLRWSLCPYCGIEQSEKAAAARERVEKPAARWRSDAVPRRRTTPAIVAHPATVAARPEFPIPQGADLTPPAVADATMPALSVVRDGAGGPPVRLFDRKKTRAAQKNGSDRSLAERDSGSARMRANGNGHAAAASSDHHAPYLVETPTNQNAHAPNGSNGSDLGSPREKVGAQSAVDAD